MNDDDGPCTAVPRPSIAPGRSQNTVTSRPSWVGRPMRDIPLTTSPMRGIAGCPMRSNPLRRAEAERRSPRCPGARPQASVRERSSRRPRRSRPATQTFRFYARWRALFARDHFRVASRVGESCSRMKRRFSYGCRRRPVRSGSSIRGVVQAR